MQATKLWNLYNLSSKKVILSVLFLFVCFTLQAQFNIKKHDNRNRARGYSYGIHLAFNQHNFRVEHSENFLEQGQVMSIEGHKDMGVEVGIIGALHPHENIEIRAIPGINFGNRNVVYYETFAEEPTQVKLENTMFDLPLQLKYKSKPYKDFRMFVVGGGKLRANLNYKEASENPAEDPLRLSKGDFMMELGAGAEFHFPLFTLAPELKISQGFQNQRVQNEAHVFSNTLSALYSRLYTLSINIE